MSIEKNNKEINIQKLDNQNDSLENDKITIADRLFNLLKNKVSSLKSKVNNIFNDSKLEKEVEEKLQIILSSLEEKFIKWDEIYLDKDEKRFIVDIFQIKQDSWKIDQVFFNILMLAKIPEVVEKLWAKYFENVYENLSKDEKEKIEKLTDLLIKYRLFLDKLQQDGHRDYITIPVFMYMYHKHWEEFFSNKEVLNKYLKSFNLHKDKEWGWTEWNWRNNDNTGFLIFSIKKWEIKKIENLDRIFTSKDLFFAYLSWLKHNYWIDWYYITSREDNEKFFDKYSGSTTTLMNSVVVEKNREFFEKILDIKCLSEESLNTVYEHWHVWSIIDEKIIDYLERFVKWAWYTKQYDKAKEYLKKLEKKRKLFEESKKIEKINKNIADLKEQFLRVFSKDKLEKAWISMSDIEFLFHGIVKKYIKNIYVTDIWIYKLPDNNIAIIWQYFDTQIEGSNVIDYINTLLVIWKGNKLYYKKIIDSYLFRTTYQWVVDYGRSEVVSIRLEDIGKEYKLLVEFENGKEIDFNLNKDYIEDDNIINFENIELDKNYQEIEKKKKNQISLKDLPSSLQQQIKEEIEKIQRQVSRIPTYKDWILSQYSHMINKSFKPQIHIVSITRKDWKIAVDIMIPYVEFLLDWKAYFSNLWPKDYYQIHWKNKTLYFNEK